MRTRLAQHLPTLHIFLLRATQQRTDVVTRPTLIEQLAEHLHTRAHRLLRRLQPNDLQIITRMHDALLDLAGHDRATTRDREHILDRHQERLVQLTSRLRNRLHHTPSINSMILACHAASPSSAFNA